VVGSSVATDRATVATVHASKLGAKLHFSAKAITTTAANVAKATRASAIRLQVILLLQVLLLPVARKLISTFPPHFASNSN
jgi:hypothetical protein